ncbi:hypothetical protein KSS87_010815 [Heliosperma pusillum]|nr:hypothetical protein KSS87_010815 [Heliosperma pusillum]
MSEESSISSEGRTLDQTPTWAVAAVCALIVLISFFLENALHGLGTLLKKRQKAGLYEALDKVKGELMVLGFISLLLTFSQGYICRICVPSSVAQTMLPCTLDASQQHDRRLLSSEQQTTCFNYKCKKEGYESLVTVEAAHQLHILIFFLAVIHVLYSAVTMMLGKVKGCFFRQFFKSVNKSDYLTLRHGFITAHIAPGRKFDFQKYIKRSLEDDFKVVVGVSPVLWVSFVIFLLLNAILAIGTKLQCILTKMALEITERHTVIQGIPLVQGSDTYFWFSNPRLILHLLHFSLFQYEFGLDSCFHDTLLIEFIKITLGIGAMVLCSYSILPLYALVSQMGSHMKKVIFDEQMSNALKKWQKAAKKKQSVNDKPPTRTLGGVGSKSSTSSLRQHSSGPILNRFNSSSRLGHAPATDELEVPGYEGEKMTTLRSLFIRVDDDHDENEITTLPNVEETTEDVLRLVKSSSMN